LLYLVFEVRLRECSNHFKKSPICQEPKLLKPLSCILRESFLESDRINPLCNQESSHYFANLAKNTYTFAHLAVDRLLCDSIIAEVP
jgi:hypothetical protein